MPIRVQPFSRPMALRLFIAGNVLVPTLAGAQVQVGPNRIRTAAAIPKGPSYSTQQTYLRAMHLPGAWNRTTGSSSMVIALVDSGVLLNHPDLAGRLVPGWDFVDDDDDPSDVLGHGTQVAGVLAASTNNWRGVTGATWKGKIMPIKVIDSRGKASDDHIAAGIEYAVKHGATVINLSLAGPGRGTDVVQRAVDFATAHDVVVVAAAGNDGGTADETVEHYPAACNGVIAVGSTDAAGHHSHFSSSGSWVDVVAPGEGIVTTTRPANGSPGFYGSGSGTSFAAPLVAGVAFLLRSADPNASQATIVQRLIATARDLGRAGVDSVYGSGMVDATAALDAGSSSFSTASANRSRYWTFGQPGAVYRFGAASLPR
jgi:subtilisin family serine protease